MANPSVYKNISAIAAEDAELARIIDAESERLRYVIEMLPGTEGPEPAIEQTLRIGEDIRRTLQTVTNMQMLSLQKLSQLLGNL